jgi:hypothetical protein
MKNYDVAVAYRIYPKVSKVPLVFKDSKYDLAKLCLKSFKDSIGSLKVKIFALLDNCPPEYEALFLEYFDEEDLNLIRLDGIGNLSTFSMQIKLLLEQTYSQLIYFAEDDYFYLPNQFESMVKLLQENSDRNVHFITPYDHLDFYTLDLHAHQVEVQFANNKHWKTGSSTCLTFLTTKEILQETKDIFLTYSKGNYDASLWLSLTKYKIFSISDIVKYYFNNRFLFDLIKRAYFHSWKQILFGKVWKLWSPIPSIATHMESNYLAPGINWQNVINQTIHENQSN